MKFRKFHMPIKIGIRRKIEIILNATEFLTNFCSTKITENESIFENSEIFKIIREIPWMNFDFRKKILNVTIHSY